MNEYTVHLASTRGDNDQRLQKDPVSSYFGEIKVWMLCKKRVDDEEPCQNPRRGVDGQVEEMSHCVLARWRCATLDGAQRQRLAKHSVLR